MKKVALLLTIALLVFGSLATVAGANNPKVVITPINYKATDQVVTLLNKTNEEVALTGFRIRDGAGNVFRFSGKETETVNLSPFGVLRIHSGPGARKNYDGKMDFYWTDKAIWDKEKTAQLVNPQGKVVYKLDLSEVGEIDQLAGCLTRNTVVFYGMKTCSHCQAQKGKVRFRHGVHKLHRIYRESRKM